MHVLIVSAVYPPHVIGGAETAAYRSAEALVGRGHRVSVLTMAEDEEPEQHGEGDASGAAVHRLRFFGRQTTYSAQRRPRPTHSWKLWHLVGFVDPVTFWRCLRLLRSIRPDQIHIHLLDGIGYIFLLAARLTGTPVFFITHDLSIACTTSSMFRDGRDCAEPCRRCRAVSRVKQVYIRALPAPRFVSPSRANLDRLASAVPVVAASDRAVLRNVPPALPEGLPARPDAPPGRIRILFAGRIHETKGIAFILPILEELASSDRFVAEIYGGGPLLDDLRSAYAGTPAIRFHGFRPQEEVLGATAEADLLIVPSIWAENYSTTIVQALQLGIPVLASDKGGNAELVTSGENGLLLPAGDANAWRTALSRFLDDPGFRAGLQAGAAGARARVDRARLEAAYVDFFEQAQSTPLPDP